MTIFISGKQKRIRHPVLIDGLDPNEFYLRNADPIALHGEGLWECMEEIENSDTDLIYANATDFLRHSDRTVTN